MHVKKNKYFNGIYAFGRRTNHAISEAYVIEKKTGLPRKFRVPKVRIPRLRKEIR